MNGYVPYPSSKNDYVDDNLSPQNSGELHNGHSDYTTIPMSTAKNPGANSDESSKKATEQTMNGYVAITPTVVTNSDPKSCNEQSSDYVTNQQQSIVKPNFVLAV